MSWTPRKPDGPSPGALTPPHADPGSFASEYPALAWYLSASQWPDGSAKPAARIELTVYLGKWQATLRVSKLPVMLRVEVPGPEYLFEAVDAALRLETVPWTPDPFFKPDAPQKGQRKPS